MMRSNAPSTPSSTGASLSATRPRVRSIRTAGSSGSSRWTIPEARLARLTTADLRAFLERWRNRSAVDAIERRSRSCTRSSDGRGRGHHRAWTRRARSAVRRSEGPTSTGRASTSSAESAARRYRTSDPRSCSWKVRASAAPRSSAAGGPTSTWSAGECACTGRADTGTGSRSIPTSWTSSGASFRAAATRARRSRVHGRGRAVGVAVRARAAAEEPEAAGERSSADADGVARLQARRRPAPLPSPASTRLRQPFPARERSRRRRAAGADGSLAPDTTQHYTDEVELDELAEALDRAAALRHAQASPDLTTLETEVSDELRNP